VPTKSKGLAGGVGTLSKGKEKAQGGKNATIWTFEEHGLSATGAIKKEGGGCGKDLSDPKRTKTQKNNLEGRKRKMGRWVTKSNESKSSPGQQNKRESTDTKAGMKTKHGLDGYGVCA